MAAVTPADPAAEAKTRARRTLIGSAILALTAVVVVPLVMDSKPRPWSDDVVLQIPSKDSKFETPLQAPAVSPTASPAASTPVASPGPTKPAAASAAVTPEPSKPVQAASPTPAAKPEAAPTKQEAKPAATASTPKPEAKPEPKPSPKPTAANAPAVKAGKVVLQAGAFTTEERIKSVEADLRKAGFTPYREEIETKSGTVTRVRFTVASEDAAAKAVAKLSAAGITPKIIPQ
jgi:DedD protein